MVLGMLPLMPVLCKSLRSHSTLSCINGWTLSSVMHYSQLCQRSEVADGAGDAPADVRGVKVAAEPQHPQPRQQPTLIHTTQCAAHSCVSALRLPMVLGMLPLMPVLDSPLPEPQHAQPHQQPTLIHTTQCAAHRYVSALRLLMVLGMLPLMPMLNNDLPEPQHL